MKKIYALTDYKDHFGSKWNASPYRSGFDKSLLKEYFQIKGYDVVFVRYRDISFKEDWTDCLVIYTSSEEPGLYYKSFIEDIILSLERSGALVIPDYSFLRANNNKVFMESLKRDLLGEEFNRNTGKGYGTLEEALTDLAEGRILFPCVVKKASGSMSKGVFLARDKKELIRNVKKVSRTRDIKNEAREFLRSIRHRGYIRESGYQNKFILQPFIPDLKNDWKILIYGDHYYILNRGIKKEDFRASGSHFNYKAGSASEFPIKMLDNIEHIYNNLDVPHLSIDYAYDGTYGYIHEFQALHFGTSTLEFCDGYYKKVSNEWIFEKKHFDQEEEYVRGLVHYLKGQG
jgi:glutathione synthase/RimK-type ligase-like ATP-grasp enzyme